METVKVVVTGPFCAGKTEFVKAVSEGGVVATERRITCEAEKIKEFTTVAMDFGRITMDDQQELFLFGTPGQKRFDFMWKVLSEGMKGFVVMVDSSRPETFCEAREILDAFRAFGSIPYVVAANRQDAAGAAGMEAIRLALKVEPGRPIMPCSAVEPISVRRVLETLLDCIRSEARCFASTRMMASA